MISADKCKHYNGTVNARCGLGIAYESVMVDHDRMVCGSGHEVARSLPCMRKYNPGGATCDKQEFPTPEELAVQEAKDERTTDLMRRGLSSCCESPIDESRVIREGRHKGHGPRFCSKCGRCVLVV